MKLKVTEGWEAQNNGSFSAEMYPDHLEVKVTYLRPDGVTTRRYTMNIEKDDAERLAHRILGVD